MVLLNRLYLRRSRRCVTDWPLAAGLAWAYAGCSSDRPLAFLWFHPGRRLPLDVRGRSGVALSLAYSRRRRAGLYHGTALAIVFARCRNHHSIALGCCGRGGRVRSARRLPLPAPRRGAQPYQSAVPSSGRDSCRPLNEESQQGRRAFNFLGDRWPHHFPLLETSSLLPRPYVGVRAFRAARLCHACVH